MRILIIGTAESLQLQDPHYYEKFISLMRDALPGVGQVDQVYFDDLYIGIGDGRFIIRILPAGTDIAEYDLILLRGQRFRSYRDVLKIVSFYGHTHGVPVVNDYRQNRDGSKLAQAMEFYEAGLPAPYTVLVTPAVIEATAEQLGIEFPCIMKATLGARGEDNYLVHDLNEIGHIQSEHPLSRFILQRLVPNDCDYRLLLIGDEYAIIRRTAQGGSHLNNTSQGGAAELLPADALPLDVIGSAQSLARQMLLTTAGVDVLQDKTTGEYYFLEVNSQPQLMSGAFLDTKRDLLAAYLRSLQTRPERPAGQ
jgi:glutathione synthase/RimK-type ligase-like ATP-grasp enzyme